MAHSSENLNELVGKYYIPAEFIDYKANSDYILPIIYQSGYLTVKGYDPEMNTFMLDYPNREVQDGFIPLAASAYFKDRRQELDGTADEALAQIEEKGYARPYGADGRQVIRIGASFSSETDTVGEWKTVSGTRDI